MFQLTEEQLNSLDKNALIILVASLQEQMQSMNRQLEAANAHLDDNNRQIELLIEQLRLMNQRQFGRKTESNLSQIDGQLTLFDSLNEAEGFQCLKTPEPS